MKQKSYAEYFSKHGTKKPVSTRLQKNFPFIDNRLNKSSCPLLWSDLGDEKIQYLLTGVITQCNPKCNCRKNNKKCTNSVTDSGLSVKLRISLHSDERHWHVVADEDIQQGTYLGKFSNNLSLLLRTIFESYQGVYIGSIRPSGKRSANAKANKYTMRADTAINLALERTNELQRQCSAGIRNNNIADVKGQHRTVLFYTFKFCTFSNI